MKRVVAVAIVLSLSGLISVARADDKKGPTGTWTWEAPGQNGQTRKVTLKLKVEGDKVTGSMPGRNNQETKIDDGTFKDGTIKFTVTRERNGNKSVTSYSGKVDGDTLKLTIESERNGEKQKRDVEAKRSGD
jgi:hypothetical protein